MHMHEGAATAEREMGLDVEGDRVPREVAQPLGASEEVLDDLPPRPTGIRAVTRWFNMNGRISVRTFRQRMALLGLSYAFFVVLVLISELFYYSEGVGLLLVQLGKYVLFVLGALVAVKRCHDLGQPGAMVLLPPIWLLLWSASGKDEPNAYGEREW